jgi:predicted ATPase
MNLPPLPLDTSPLVGRDKEVDMLRQCLDAALVGHGRLVLIGGDAGVGKTALAEALCREAEEQGALVLVGRCYDLTETPPYGPWIELLVQGQTRWCARV